MIPTNVYFVLAVLLALPPTVYFARIKGNIQWHHIAWFVAGMFTLCTVPLSAFGLFLQLKNFNEPDIQRYVLRILWMPLIYAFSAWFSLLFRQYAMYWALIRELYEAYCIYSFLFFLMLLIQHSGRVQERWKRRPSPRHRRSKKAATVNGIGTPCASLNKSVLEPQQQMHHLFPFCCLRQWSIEIIRDAYGSEDSEFLRRCRRGVLQYVVLKIGTSITTFITETLHVYEEGDFKYNRSTSF
jgi:hypothetical protein